jgi:hypothetical protein
MYILLSIIPLFIKSIVHYNYHSKIAVIVLSHFFFSGIFYNNIFFVLVYNNNKHAIEIHHISPL